MFYPVLIVLTHLWEFPRFRPGCIEPHEIQFASVQASRVWDSKRKAHRRCLCVSSCGQDPERDTTLASLKVLGPFSNQGNS